MQTLTPAARVTVAVAGEALIDLVAQRDGRYEPCLGGAPFNLAKALARQDVGTLYLNPLSHDRFGQQLAASLAADGVVLGQARPVIQPTSLAVVTLDDAGHPEYAFYRDGVADRATSAGALTLQCQTEAALELVCTGALALDPADAACYLPWLRAQREAGRVVVVDANLRPAVIPDRQAYCRHVYAVLGLADIVKVSDEDLAHLGAPGEDALAQAWHVLEVTNAQWLLLTRGAAGASLLTRAGPQWHVREAMALPVVDTIGAGDCFLASFLACLLTRRGGPVQAGTLMAPLDEKAGCHLLTHAVAGAGFCVMRRGCVPPTRLELEARIESAAFLFGWV